MTGLQQGQAASLVAAALLAAGTGRLALALFVLAVWAALLAAEVGQP